MSDNPKRMTSFRWKRKTGSGVVRTASEAFEKEAKNEEVDNEVTRGEVDWLTQTPVIKKRLICLEDNIAKSRRLREEGATLAQSERFWEAIKKWDEGLLLVPNDSRMLEMKAQALMAVGEVFPAVQTAEQSVKADPTWWEGLQTLGRAQLNMGEVEMAVKSFSKAVMMNPVDRDLWEKDLMWACSLRECSRHVAATSATSPASSLTSLEEAASSQSCNDVIQTGTVVCDETTDYVVDRSTDNELKRNTDESRTLLRVPSDYVHLRG